MKKKFKEYRLEAQLSIAQLAKVAHVDRRTATRADSGEPIRDVKAVKLVKALNEALKMEIKFDDIEDLKLV